MGHGVDTDKRNGDVDNALNQQRPEGPGAVTAMVTRTGVTGVVVGFVHIVCVIGSVKVFSVK